MDEKPKYQFSIADVLLVTALAAGILAAITSGQAEIAFITASCMLLGIWNRPVMLRLWAVGILGLGAGLFSAGCVGRNGMNVPSGTLVGWGAGMMVGSIAALVVFRDAK